MDQGKRLNLVLLIFAFCWISGFLNFWQRVKQYFKFFSVNQYKLSYFCIYEQRSMDTSIFYCLIVAFVCFFLFCFCCRGDFGKPILFFNKSNFNQSRRAYVQSFPSDTKTSLFFDINKHIQIALQFTCMQDLAIHPQFTAMMHVAS